MSETKAASIPTAQELDEWANALRYLRYPRNDFIPRLLEGYRRLLVVAEKARPCVALDAVYGFEILYCSTAVDEATLRALAAALKALDAPVEGKES